MGTEAVGRHDTLPHIEWVDLNDDGVAIEVVVVKRDKRNGDLYFIKTEELDQIDRDRLSNILMKRDAARYELWDLLDNTTLGNGENALDFFHQLVKVRTARGVTLVPGQGRAGIALKPESPAPAKRGPGRPPKAAE